MQRLILLNFISALLSMVTKVAYEKFESGWSMIAGGVSMLVLAGLALWNFCSIFLLWGHATPDEARQIVFYPGNGIAKYNLATRAGGERGVEGALL